MCWRRRSQRLPRSEQRSGGAVFVFDAWPWCRPGTLDSFRSSSTSHACMQALGACTRGLSVLHSGIRSGGMHVINCLYCHQLQHSCTTTRPTAWCCRRSDSRCTARGHTVFTCTRGLGGAPGHGHGHAGATTATCAHPRSAALAHGHSRSWHCSQWALHVLRALHFEVLRS